MSHSDVQHYPDQQKFVIPLDGDDAVLEYHLLNPHTVDFTHTYVPFRQRGKGHAETLVAAGLAWAKENNLTMQASCWYVDKFLKSSL